MEAKHTPGPWFLNERYEAVTNKDGEFIAMWATDCGDPIAPEDLKLIAAAPDLLKALNYAIRFIRLCPLINEDQYPKGLENWELLIKKATE